MSSSQPPPGGPQGPEYLEQGTGAPYRPERTPGGRSGLRTGILAGAGVAVLALVGGGVWAATSFFGTGAQPAEALPASTLGYVSVDLDPSGGQKIEAVRTLRKFPAFREKVGLNTDDDVRRKIFDEIQKGARCQGLDYADDVEPWLGDRAAVAAVDTGGEQPSPVFVVQVKDADQADAGLRQLRSCGGDGAKAGWSIHDGWAVIAETDTIAERVATDAAKAPLSDDTDFQHWSGEVGDPGIVSMYAAPSSGAYLADNLGRLSGLGTGTPASGAAANEELKGFKGAAATIRFNDGSLELEVAADSTATSKRAYAGTRGDDVLATLPTDTAAAFGVGFTDDWFTTMADQMSAASGGDTKALLSGLSEQTGLDLPGDVETLAGRSLAIGVGSGFDPETFANSSDGSGVPVAAKVEGDVKGIESVLDKVRGRMGSGATPLDSDSSGDMVVVGPDAAYRREVLKDGGLGTSEAFTRVVPQAQDASAVFFVNFDAGGNWVAKLAGGDRQVEDNLKPLQALGLSGWQDGDTSRALLRLTTN